MSTFILFLVEYVVTYVSKAAHFCDRHISNSIEMDLSFELPHIYFEPVLGFFYRRERSRKESKPSNLFKFSVRRVSRQTSKWHVKPSNSNSKEPLTWKNLYSEFTKINISNVAVVFPCQTI
jgi:hypothetical protein